ncbi:MAG: bifunctional (p)ppGpp synthetase/guanosine-3',5'-bis(diphosphate) 3'-pyrophosphohydrolase [bacterium]
MVRYQDIQEAVKSYMPGADTALLRKAYVFAAMTHKGQLRKGGIPYLSHPLAVTKILTDLKMDIPALCGGLLHDVLEDNTVSEETLRSFFGEEVAQLVAGLSRTARLSLQSKSERKLESYRKMLVAMSGDVRILLIRLADRLDNVRSLQDLTEEQRTRVAQETLAVYAPLANRLGIYWMRAELEDLAFQHLKPETYTEIQNRVDERVEAKTRGIEQVSEILRSHLETEGITAEISGRVKHYYSIYRKMLRQETDLDQVYDLLAVRVIVPEYKHCYQVLGVIHALWAPVPGRFKDYIAKPKGNQYRSLHTTVIGPTGDAVEIQVRSREMHLEAEQGVAAHWMYKEKAGFDKKDEEKFQWLRRYLSTVQELSRSKDFLDAVQLDLFPEEVYVFTPKGEVRELIRGATPIDFAFQIHTEVGHHCTGAKVNGKIVPLRYELQNGDIIEILTSKGQTPKKDWLKIVKTAEARSKIRSWFRQEERDRAEVLGKEILEKSFRKAGFQYAKLLQDGDFKAVLKKFQLRSTEDLLRAVAYGKIPVSQIIESLPGNRAPEKDGKEWEKDLGKLMERVEKRSESGVRVRGVPDVLIRFARCCNPLHGEEIVGFITRGRGVTIHATSCPKIREADPQRWIEVQWEAETAILHKAKIRVVSQDWPGLLAGISKAIAETDVNIANAKVWTTEAHQGLAHFEVMVKNLDHLNLVIRSVEKVKGVISVERLVH